MKIKSVSKRDGELCWESILVDDHPAGTLTEVIRLRGVKEVVVHWNDGLEVHYTSLPDCRCEGCPGNESNT